MIMSQVLFTWHEKHPTPGYFQGINDLVVPFLVLFLNEYVQIDFCNLTNIGHLEKMTQNNYEELAADVYFCVSQLIDMIYQNYLDSQIATAEALNKIANIVEKIDLELSQHLEKEATESGITMQQIYTTLLLDWIFCLLLRVFPLNLIFVLFDTYLADQKAFPVLHIYVCVALLLKFSTQLKSLNLQDINMFFQNLPVQTWNIQHLRMIIQEAFVFQSLFETSQAHLKKKEKEEEKSGSTTNRSQEK